MMHFFAFTTNFELHLRSLTLERYKPCATASIRAFGLTAPPARRHASTT